MNSRAHNASGTLFLTYHLNVLAPITKWIKRTNPILTKDGKDGSRTDVYTTELLCNS